MQLSLLTQSASPWLHVWPGLAGDVADSLRQWEAAAPDQRVARIVRGQYCTTAADLFREWAAALQFPLGFGENWDALADCLRDWRWLPPKSAVAIGIVDAEKLLNRAPTAATRTLAKVLSMCLEDVNAPAKPSKPRPMHVIFQCAAAKSAAVAKRWQATVH